MSNVAKFKPGSLPATLQDVLGGVEVPPRPLADAVQDIYFKLYEDPTFQEYRKALYREECAEGSFQDDDALSAKMIKDAAKQTGTPTYNPQVAELKNSIIRRLIGVVERRWKIDRKHRKSIAEGYEIDENPKIFEESED